MPFNSLELLESADSNQLNKWSIFTPFGMGDNNSRSDTPLWLRISSIPLDFFCHLGVCSVGPAFFVGKSVYENFPASQIPIILIIIPAVITFALSLALAAILVVPRTIGTIARAVNESIDAVQGMCCGNS